MQPHGMFRSWVSWVTHKTIQDMACNPLAIGVASNWTLFTTMHSSATSSMSHTKTHGTNNTQTVFLQPWNYLRTLKILFYTRLYASVKLCDISFFWWLIFHLIHYFTLQANRRSSFSKDLEGAVKMIEGPLQPRFSLTFTLDK